MQCVSCFFSLRFVFMYIHSWVYNYYDCIIIMIVYERASGKIGVIKSIPSISRRRRAKLTIDCDRPTFQRV